MLRNVLVMFVSVFFLIGCASVSEVTDLKCELKKMKLEHEFQLSVLQAKVGSVETLEQKSYVMDTKVELLETYLQEKIEIEKKNREEVLAIIDAMMKNDEMLRKNIELSVKALKSRYSLENMDE